MDRPSSWKPPAWAPATLLAAVSLVAAATLGMHPTDPHEAAAIFPFWWKAGQAVEAASRAGDIVAVGAAPFVVIARSETPDIAAALRAQGAWLTIDPGLAVACGG